MKQDNITENLQLLSNVLETGESVAVEHEILGNIFVRRGSIGENGSGLLHIIENRIKTNEHTIDEVASILILIVESLKTGTIFEGKKNRAVLEKNGIWAIIEKGKNNKWLLTGYVSNRKRGEALDAIQAVISTYSYVPEFSFYKTQVGAVASQVNIVNSPENVNQNFKKNDKEKNMETRQNPRSLLDEVRRIIKEELGDSNTRQGKIKILNETIKSSSVARDLIRGYYGEVDVFFCEYASEIASLYREVTGEKYYPFTAAHQMVMDGFALCAGKLYHELMQRIEDSED